MPDVKEPLDAARTSAASPVATNKMRRHYVLQVASDDAGERYGGAESAYSRASAVRDRLDRRPHSGCAGASWLNIGEVTKKATIKSAVRNWLGADARGWWPRIRDQLLPLSLSHQFILACVTLGIVGLSILGAWIPQKIEEGVEAHSAARTALYMESLTAPSLQELAGGQGLSESAIQALNEVLAGDARRVGVIAVKVWTGAGVVAYATAMDEIGRKEKVTLPMAKAWDGYLEAELVDGRSTENAPLLEVYVPIRQEKTHEVIAIARFSEVAAELQTNQDKATFEGIIIGAVLGFLIFAGLYLIVAKGNRTIEAQRASLVNRVTELSNLLQETERLRRYAQTASSRAAEDVELQLCRVGSDLHDGPAQLLALALLKLDVPPQGGGLSPKVVDAVRDVLGEALTEIRDISAGLALPEIAGLSLGQALIVVASEHERRTSTRVVCDLPGKSIEIPHVIKLCLCRVIQEALSNTFKHAGGRGQEVKARWTDEAVTVEISDTGPGMAPSKRQGKRPALGLVGLRSRLESFGGELTIESQAGVGTRLTASLPICGHGEGA